MYLVSTIYRTRMDGKEVKEALYKREVKHEYPYCLIYVCEPELVVINLPHDYVRDYLAGVWPKEKGKK